MKLSRRSFLKNGARTGAAASLASSLTIFSPRKVLGAPSTLNKWPGRLVFNYDDRHTCNATGSSNVASDKAKMQTRVDDTIKMLTGKSTVGEAWKAVFPSSLSLTNKIAIKTNLLYTTSHPHPYIMLAITEGLKQMNIGGTLFPAANIYIYDRGRGDGNIYDNGGYTTVFAGTGVNLCAAGLYTAGDYAAFGDGAANNSEYCKYFHDCTYMINVAGTKGHQAYVGGFSLAFKSHYGTYKPLYHDTATSYPFLRDINCTGPVFAKQVLCVLGSIYSSNEGTTAHNPSENFNVWAKTMNPAYTGSASNVLVMSSDPVATEVQGIKVLRINKGLSYALNTLPPYLHVSGGVDSPGLTPTYNIGEIHEGELCYGEVVNGTVTHAICSVAAEEAEGCFAGARMSVNPNPANAQAFIHFVLPDNYIGQKAEIVICNMKGAAVRRFGRPVLGARTTAVWDGRNGAGRPCASGRYVAEVRVTGRKLVTPFTVLR